MIKELRYHLLPIMLLTNGVCAQDFIRVGTGLSFEDDDKSVQSLTIDLNRTEAKKEKDGLYFLFTDNNFYILPVIDVNLGESVSTSQNNARFTARVGKNFFPKSGSTYFFVNGEPTYNADKAFEEKLFYLNLNGGLTWYRDNDTFVNLRRQTAAVRKPILYMPFEEGKDEYQIVDLDRKDTLETKAYEAPKNVYEKPFTKSEYSLSIGTSNNFGSRESKTFDLTSPYTTVGGFIILRLQWNSNNLEVLKKNAAKTNSFDYANADLKKYANWKLEIRGTLYSIVNDLQEVTTNNSAGLLKVSLDKMITPKIYASAGYQLGNDQPAYEQINALEFGLKIKFEE